MFSVSADIVSDGESKPQAQGERRDNQSTASGELLTMRVIVQLSLRNTVVGLAFTGKYN